MRDVFEPVAREEFPPQLDTHPPYESEFKIKKRATPLNLPAVRVAAGSGGTAFHAEPEARGVGEPHVVVLDNRFDAPFGRFPARYADRHSNLAGRPVIASWNARVFSELSRKREMMSLRVVRILRVRRLPFGERSCHHR
jgi:hypothetical protein